MITRLMIEQQKLEKAEQEKDMLTQSSQVWTEMSVEGNVGASMLKGGPQEETDSESKVRYLISSKWWEKWRDFSNFNQDFLQASASILQSDEPIQSPSPSVTEDINFTQLIMNDGTSH